MARQTPQLLLLLERRRSVQLALLLTLLSTVSVHGSQSPTLPTLPASATSPSTETLLILPTSPTVPPLHLFIQPNDTTFFGLGRGVEIVCSPAVLPGASASIELRWVLSCEPTCTANSQPLSSPATFRRSLLLATDATWDRVNVTCYAAGHPDASISRVIRVSERPTIEPPEARLLEGTEVNLTCTVAADDLSRDLTWSWICGGSRCPGTTGRGGRGGSSARLTFVVSALWDGAVIYCASSKYVEATVNRTIRVRRRIAPTVSPEGNITMFLGRSAFITCAFADGSATDNDLNWRFSCPPFTGVFRSDPCGPAQLTTQVTESFGWPALRIYVGRVTAAEWNGAIVSCDSALTGLSAQVNISTRPVPPLIVFPAAIDALDSMLMTVYCTASEMWTSAHLQWSVRRCSAPASSPDGCRFVDESPFNETTKRAVFTASPDWDQARLVCSADTPVSQESLITVSVRGVPPLIIIPYDEIDTYLGLNVTVTCGGGNVWSSERLWWSVRDCRTPGGRTGAASAVCLFASDERLDNVTRRVTFTATSQWNGSTIACSASVPVFQEGTVRVIVRGWPPFTLSKSKIIAYADLAIQVACMAPQPWTATQLSWSVRRCRSAQQMTTTPHRSKNQVGSMAVGCPIISDEDDSDAFDGDYVAVRQLSFTATAYWDGASIVCSSSNPIFQELAADVRVQVFPGLVLSPSERLLSLSEGTNVTLLCAASEYFRPSDLVWSTSCLQGMQCPAFKQGVMAAPSSGNDTVSGASAVSLGSGSRSTLMASWRYLSFRASNAWNNVKVTCSVSGLDSEDYRRSKVIVVNESGLSEATIAIIVIGSCIGAVAVLTFAAWAAYFSRKPKGPTRTAAEGGKRKKSPEMTKAVGGGDHKHRATRKPKATGEKAAEGKAVDEHAADVTAVHTAAINEKPTAGRAAHGGDGKKSAEKKKEQPKKTDAVPATTAAAAANPLPPPPRHHHHPSAPSRNPREVETPTATDKTATDKTVTDSTANARAKAKEAANDSPVAHGNVERPPLTPTETNKTTDETVTTAGAATKPKKHKSLSAAAGIQSAAPKDVKKQSRSVYK